MNYLICCATKDIPSRKHFSVEEGHSPEDAAANYFGKANNPPQDAVLYVIEWPPDPPPVKLAVKTEFIRETGGD